MSKHKINPAANEASATLLRKNEEFTAETVHPGDISRARRADTADHGQHPYVVIVTCADSRVPPEHIFEAGIGELFVIRTAGNVIGTYELGSIEYGVEHLGVSLVVVLGHTGCGAVQAALEGGAHGFIKNITDEILSCLPRDCDVATAERLNVLHSVERILESEVIRELEEKDLVTVRGAMYHIDTGSVDFLD